MSCQGNRVLDSGHSDILKKALADKKVLFDMQAGLSPDSIFKEVKLRYKPKEVSGFYTDIEHHYKDGNNTVVRNSGWFIQGPGDVFFSISEDALTEFFEIIEEGE